MSETDEAVDAPEELHEKVRAFIDSLSPDEAAVIETVFAAAATEAEREDEEVSGFIIDPGFSPGRVSFATCMAACLRRPQGIGAVTMDNPKVRCAVVCRSRYLGR